VAAIYYKDWDWVIGAGTYEDEIYSVRDNIRDKLHSLIYIMIVISIIIYVVGIVVATQIARRISNPIKRAANISEAISRGDFETAKKLMAE
jgi:nitrogen fixation/metabolism regulation signal transduction histidine kinase